MEEPKSLDSVFKNKIFRIPDYQRGYAWQQEQLKDFWEDLVNLSDERCHYTGVLTLKQIPTTDIQEKDEEYWLVDDHNYELYHIVDGQQRLTTLIIFLLTLVNFVKKLPENKDKTDDAIYITDTLSVAEVRSKYLFKIKPGGIQLATYKFGYTQGNPSCKYLRYKIFGEAGGGPVEENFYTLNLNNAKLYFWEQFKGLHEQEGMLGLRDVYKKLTKRFLFNEYIISNEFDVYVAFETMNNRGKKLSDLELLKNRLIYLTTLYNDEELPQADRKKLRDTINEAWKEVYIQLGRNKQQPLSDDDYLRAHWTMYFKYSRQTGQDHVRFLLEEQFTPQKVHSKVERKVALEHPEEQSSAADYVDTEDENGDVVANQNVTVSSAQLHPTEIRDFVNSLQEAAVHWVNSFYPHLAQDMAPEEQQWIGKLNRIGMAYFRPLVMAVLMKRENFQERIDIWKNIERFIFLVFRMTTTRANYASSEFYNAAREVHSAGLDGYSIKEKLKKDAAFTLNADGTLGIDYFYILLRRKFENGVGYYGWSGLRYFLYEYELSLLNESRQKKVDWSDLLKTPNDKISIEHIYPQTAEGEWAEAFKEVDADTRGYYKATLGNLLLLSAAINSSLQNDSFAEKKRAKYNAGHEKIRNGYSDGSHSEIEVSEQECWGPKQICDRGLRLLSFMEDRWDFKFKDDGEKRKILFV
jgi:hypothetical protein